MRSAFTIRPGEVITYEGAPARIRRVLSETEIYLETKTGALYQVSEKDIVREIREEASNSTSQHPEIAEQAEGTRLYKILKPMIDGHAARDDRLAILKRLGWSQAKAYRAIARFNQTGIVTSLVPLRRNGGRGKSRISAIIEEVIQNKIDEVLLTRANNSFATFAAEVRYTIQHLTDEHGEQLRTENGKPLSVANKTLRARIAGIPHDKWVRARGGTVALKELELHSGKKHYPVRPLQNVEVDHWYIDVKATDDKYVGDLKTAYATICIDVYTRMIVGFHLSLEEPSSGTMAMAMINMLSPKSVYLEGIGLDFRWPAAGKPEEVGVDNAGEFRGATLNLSAKNYGFDIKLRPTQRASYGAYIERFNGSLAAKLKDIPGSKGSNPTEKEKRSLGKPAIYTLEELERAIVLAFMEYHNLPHTGDGPFGRTPLEMWDEFFYNQSGLKRDLPRIFTDEVALMNNWYPLVNPPPTLQAYGIRHNYVTFRSPELNELAQLGFRQKKLLVREVPSNAGKLIVEDPRSPGTFFRVTGHVPEYLHMSVKELARCRRIALERKRQPTPDIVLQIRDEQRTLQHEARARSAKARTDHKKRKRHEQRRKHEERLLLDDQKTEQPEEKEHTSTEAPPPRPEDNCNDADTVDFDFEADVIVNIPTGHAS